MSRVPSNEKYASAFSPSKVSCRMFLRWVSCGSEGIAGDTDHEGSRPEKMRTLATPTAPSFIKGYIQILQIPQRDDRC
jgi:hypothetical protein